MKLRTISVYGLFNSYDHFIELSDEGLTYIHSPNGVGKSTTLNCDTARLSLSDRYGDISVKARALGDGVEYNLPEAKKWLGKAAEQGDEEAAQALEYLAKKERAERAENGL